MLLKRLAGLIAFMLLSGGVAWGSDGIVQDRTKVCMMQDSVMAEPGVPIEHGGKTYFGCCPMCGDAIKKDPERHTKSVDPVSGTSVDKADAHIYSFQERAFYFESEETRSRFASDPLRYLNASSPGASPR